MIDAIFGYLAGIDKLLTNALVRICDGNVLKSVPTKTDYDKLFANNMHREHVEPYANFYLFNLIWSNENKNELMKNWLLELNNIYNKEILIYFLNCIKPYITKIVSKEKINIIANAIMKSEYFDILTKDLNDLLTKKVLDSLPSSHKFKSELVEKEV